MLGKRSSRRRKHGPKPNSATWLILAWLAFMLAWGCKHFYRQWSEAVLEHDNPSEPAEIMQNATKLAGMGGEVDTLVSCVFE